MKIAFSFFLLIYSLCGAPASWAARHTIVCLDISKAVKRQLTVNCEYVFLHVLHNVQVYIPYMHTLSHIVLEFMEHE